MKKRQMERWVKALRSGKFKQGKFRLHNILADTYCCLGIACEINKKHLAIGCDDDGNNMSYDNEDKALPVSIREYMGLKSAVGLGTHTNDEHFCLERLNDSGKSFTEIADIIEQNYKRL